jgi:hypothetical protein
MAPHASTQNAGDTASVVAHGLLTSMAVVTAGVMTVWEHWADLTPEKRAYLFQRILAHAEIVNEGLRDVAQGLPEAAVTELEAQRRGRRRQ